MKLFTVNPTANILTKTYLDYLREIDAKINSLQNYIDSTNPNWIALNKIESVRKTINSNDIIQRSFINIKTLIENGIIKLSLFKKDDQIIPYTVLCVNKLKLHKGLVQQYGENCYYWLYDDQSWPGTVHTYNNDDINKDYVDAWYSQLTNEASAPIGLSYWEHTSNLSLVQSAVLKGEDQIVTDIVLSHENQHLVLLLKHGDIIIGKADQTLKLPVPGKQGYAIFCDVLEEGKKIDIGNTERGEMAHYKIFPVSPAGDLYIPDSAPVLSGNKYIWTWNYVPKATDIYGTQILFHLPSPHMRLVFNAADLSNWYNTHYIDLENNTYISSFHTDEGGNLIPYISNIKNTVWGSFKEDIICNKFLTQDNEEIIFDESLHYDETNFANYRIPRYNITIENMTNEDSPVPLSTDLQVYLTIV